MKTIKLNNSKFEQARKDISLSEAANRLEVTYQHLWAIERGSKKPSIDLLTKMCSVYRVPINYFFAESKNLSLT